VRKTPRSKIVPPAFAVASKKEFGRAEKHFTTLSTPGAVPPPAAASIISKKATNKRGFTFKAYKHDEVRDYIEKLFAGKCAYCEAFYSSTAPVDIEHFRPKGAIENEPTHPGYWWLAADWHNLLPSCIDCNRRRKQRTLAVNTSLMALLGSSASGQPGGFKNAGKKDAFPIKGPRATDHKSPAQLEAERPLLINPCIDDPDDHLSFVVEQYTPHSLVVPLPRRQNSTPNALDDRGAMSIQVFGLNRLGLVQERTRLLRHLEFLGEQLIELNAIIEDMEDGGTDEKHVSKLRMLADRLVDELRRMTKPDQPFSALASTWLEQYVSRIRPLS
jgi:hypothetical protein